MQIVVLPADSGLRLDVFVSRHLPALSRARIQQLIAEGHIRRPGGAVKAALRVEAGWTIDVEIPAPVAATPRPEALPLTILHDDDDIVVVDKPAGLVVHPGAGHAGGTLVNALLHHVKGLSGIGGAERPGIVHRLDRGTSGVMVIAKHDRAHRALARQFHDREVHKEYVALVWGRMPAGARIDRPIGRDPKNRQRMSSRARHARTAETRVIEVAPLGAVSLVRLTIGTGRTHQIRVHLSDEGHAVVGDTVYGGARKRLPPGLEALAALDRPFLHAVSLSFAHPGTGAPVTFTAPLPADLRMALDRIGPKNTSGMFFG